MDQTTLVPSCEQENTSLHSTPPFTITTTTAITNHNPNETKTAASTSSLHLRRHHRHRHHHRQQQTKQCWGKNSHGQLGLGDTEDRGDGAYEMGDLLPTVALGANRTAVAVSAEGDRTCALLDSGKII